MNKGSINKIIPQSLQEYMELFGVEPEVIKATLLDSYGLELDEGEVFIQNYDDAAICFVQDGLIHCTRELCDDVTISLGFLAPNHLLVTEELKSFSGEFNIVTFARAVKKTSLTVLPGRALFDRVKSSETLLKFLLDCFSRRLIAYRDWHSLKDILDKRQFIILTMLGFFQVLIDSGKDDIDISVSEFAYLTGCSRQYITEIISALIKDGSIEKRYKKIVLKDMEILMSNLEHKELFSSMISLFVSQ